MFPLYIGLVSYQVITQKLRVTLARTAGLGSPEALVATQPNLVPYQEL